MSVPVTFICASLVATTRSARCRVEGARPWPTRIESAPGLSQSASTAAGVCAPAVATMMSASAAAARRSVTSSTSRSGKCARSSLAYGGDAVGVGAEEHQPVQVRQGGQQERQGQPALGAGADDQGAAGAGPGAFAGQERGDGGGAQRADAAAVHHRDGQAGDVVVEGERGVVVLVVAVLVEAVLVGGLDRDDVAGAVAAEHRVGDRVPVVGLDGEFAGVVRRPACSVR